MGAVQKLATVVIIGLVALATVLVVYLADEPNRRDGQAGTQDQLAIERGTELFIKYCLQCHGPAGLGAAGGEDPPRVGGVLNQGPFAGREFQAVYQSDDPAERTAADTFIHYRLQYGVPENPNEPVKAMPAFGSELNVEEINDLVYLIQNVDWDYVYNESLLHTGETVAQAECDATPPSESAEENAEQCELVEDPEPVYPTVPVTPVPDEEAVAAADDEAQTGEAAGGATPAAGATPLAGGATPMAGATPVAGGAPANGAAASGQVLEALDPAEWSETELTLAPGDSIEVVNAGLGEHNFVVDELGIAQDLSGEPVTITIPKDAQPGSYEFYCSVPGHKEQGMVGTLTIT